MSRTSIILIGFMGSGKSSLAKLLGKKLAMNVIDIDAEIEKESQSSITNIFKEKGESFFRDLETDFIANRKFENEIVAVGGGLPCFNDNMTKLNEIGTTIYLKISPEETMRRIQKSKNRRPLLTAFKSDEELLRYIKVTIANREVFYKQANLIITAEDLNKEDVIERIISALSQSDIHRHH